MYSGVLQREARGFESSYTGHDFRQQTGMTKLTLTGEGLYIVAAISAADDLVNRISQSSPTHIQCSVHHDLQC